MEKRKTNNGYRYREMIYIQGKVKKSPFFVRKADAKTWKAKMLAQREQIRLHGTLTKPEIKDITLGEFSRLWLESKVKSHNTERTYANYQSSLKNHILPSLSSKYLREISEHDIFTICSTLQNKGHNNKGISIIIGVLRTLLGEAIRRKFLSENPFKHFTPLPREPKDYFFWTKEEMKEFLTSNQEDDLFELYITALYTGMRKGELAGLCWDKIDWNSSVISVSRTRDKYGLRDTTKSKLIRYVPLHPGLKNLLLNYKTENRHEDFVFAHRSGTPVRVHHIYRYFRKAQDKANLDFKIRFHDLRHTFASQFMMNGGNIFDLQKILGHSDIKMTQRYAHHSPEHLQNSIKFFGFGDDHEQADNVLTLC